MIKGAFYEHVNGNTTLMFKVLSIPFEGEFYTKLKVEWYNKQGAFWGNAYGLPRHFKLDNDARRNWKRRIDVRRQKLREM